MRKIALALALAVAAAGFALVAPAAVDAGAASTSDVYVVHGLNMAGQDEQSDGGTNVTACTGDTPLVPNFEFGQVQGPVPVPTGTNLPVQVYEQDTPGTPVDCSNPGAAVKIIDQTVTVEAGTVALVATSQESPPPPELKQYVLNTDCVDPGNGRLTGAHAANAGTVDVLVNGSPVGQLDYGQLLDADLPAGTVKVQVDLSGSPIVAETDVEVVEANNRVIYVVGNQPITNGVEPGSAEPEAPVANTPVVPLIQDLPLDTCETPVEPEPEADAAPASVVAARPTFTG